MMEKPRTKRRRPELKFLANFGRSWKQAGGYWYKIPDASGVSALTTPARPYDVDAAMNQIIYVIEGKYTDNVCLQLSDFEKKRDKKVVRNQIDALLEASRHGYQAFALVCYGRLNKKVADFFSVATLQDYRAKGINKVDPAHAALRVYALNSTEWMIEPRAIKCMTIATVKIPDLFEAEKQ